MCWPRHVSSLSLRFNRYSTILPLEAFCSADVWNLDDANPWRNRPNPSTCQAIGCGQGNASGGGAGKTRLGAKRRSAWPDHAVVEVAGSV